VQPLSKTKKLTKFNSFKRKD